MKRSKKQLNAISKSYQRIRNNKIDELFKANGWEQEFKNSHYKLKSNFIRNVKKISL